MRRFRFEYFKKTDKPDIAVYRVTFGNEVLAQLSLNKEEIAVQDSMDKKIKFIEDVCKTFPDISRQKALFNFAHLDKSLLPYYQSQFQAGGRRKSSSENNSGENDRAHRLNINITIEEKQYLQKCLEEYRKARSIRF